MQAKSFSAQEKKQLLEDAFWDRKIDPDQVYDLITGRIESLPLMDKKSVFARLLSTYNWFTLLKLLPEQALEETMTDDVLSRLYPRELRGKYRYARSLLFK